MQWQGKANNWTDFGVFRYIKNVGSVNPEWNCYLGCSGCGMPTTQFGYKFWQCEHDRCGFNLHLMRIGWMRIQFAFKQNPVWKDLKFTCINMCRDCTRSSSLIPFLLSTPVHCMVWSGCAALTVLFSDYTTCKITVWFAIHIKQSSNLLYDLVG